MHYKIVRNGNLLWVKPADRALRDVLSPALTYTFQKQLRGAEKWEAGTNMVSIPISCYTRQKKRLFTNFGYLGRIKRFLVDAGHSWEYVDLTRFPRPAAYKPDWSRIKDHKLRYRQREVLEIIARCEGGRIDCPTGYGKGYLIGLTALLFPRARIDVTTVSAEICRQLFGDLRAIVPSVGLIGGGKRIRARRVQVYSGDSLHHSDFDADFLFADEVHEFATESRLPKLCQYHHARMFGLSASHNQRIDNADFELHGLFGPIRIRVSYAQAEKHKMIVPLEVHWHRVKMRINPCEGDEDTVRMRRGIWRNRIRNAKIAGVAKRYDEKTQVLITVATIDHAMRLKKLLPEYTLVYSDKGFDAKRRKRYIRQGFIEKSEPVMTLKRREQLATRFKRGKLKKVIATTVWNRGVDFRRLQVLIRAEAGGSDIGDTQIPGRVARIDTATDKQRGVIHDFIDEWDRGFNMRSAKRRRNYEKKGWKQYCNNEPITRGWRRSG